MTLNDPQRSFRPNANLRIRAPEPVTTPFHRTRIAEND
jgi:hypothetical protein